MDERARRIGHNEALFREVNERVKALTDEFDAADEPMEIMCECGDRSCRGFGRSFGPGRRRRPGLRRGGPGLCCRFPGERFQTFLCQPVDAHLPFSRDLSDLIVQ